MLSQFQLHGDLPHWCKVGIQQHALQFTSRESKDSVDAAALFYLYVSISEQ
jgi:hypothetical protein